jgi:hypothetical protein
MPGFGASSSPAIHSLRPTRCPVRALSSRIPAISGTNSLDKGQLAFHRLPTGRFCQPEDLPRSCIALHDRAVVLAEPSQDSPARQLRTVPSVRCRQNRTLEKSLNCEFARGARTGCHKIEPVCSVKVAELASSASCRRVDKLTSVQGDLVNFASDPRPVPPSPMEVLGGTIHDQGERNRLAAERWRH